MNQHKRFHIYTVFIPPQKQGKIVLYKSTYKLIAVAVAIPHIPLFFLMEEEKKIKC